MEQEGGTKEEREIRERKRRKEKQGEIEKQEGDRTEKIFVRKGQEGKEEKIEKRRKKTTVNTLGTVYSRPHSKCLSCETDIRIVPFFQMGRLRPGEVGVICSRSLKQ